MWPPGRHHLICRPKGRRGGAPTIKKMGKEMPEPNEKKVILYAEDNDDHFLLTQEAFDFAALPYAFRRVRDGEELLDYLKHRRSFQDRLLSPAPELILLDLNMPRMDGRRALAAIKADSGLRNIPVLVFTTSKSDEDRLYAGKLGAAAFVLKPAKFEEFVQFMRMIPTYIQSMGNSN